MFIKELNLYLDYLKNKVDESRNSMNKKQEKYLISFSKNLQEGIGYYDDLFAKAKDKFEETRNQLYKELESAKDTLSSITQQIEDLRLQPVRA
jgi:hypothetical protein